MPDYNIKWIKFDSGADVNTAFIAKELDFGALGSSPVARGLSAPLNIPYSVAFVLDVAGITLSYAFPPLIMHTVLNENTADCTRATESTAWRRALWLTYALVFATWAYAIATFTGWLPWPRATGRTG